MEARITAATRKLYRHYDSIRGKNKKELGPEFWDLVVITASDASQKDAFQKQVEDKLKKKEIPSGLPYLVYADPPGPRAGCGGSTMYIISELEKKYGWDKLSSWRVLLINAGGLSQRLPSASILGKIFGALPVGDPMYQMLDIKLASYLPFLKRMAPGFFHGPSDTIEVYDVGEDDSLWDFQQAGFTALAHPSSLGIGTGHGVFVLEKTDHQNLDLVDQKLCLEVLQKPTIETMKDKMAVAARKSSGAADREFVYTDSAFFFDHGVAKKLMGFYRTEEPLNCEIDAYGDFLQALGSNATNAYTRDTRNVSKVEDNLTQMRKKIYDLLHGTPLTVVALNESQFHHFGTISECLSHFCEEDALGKHMGFEKLVSSKLIAGPASDEPSPAKRPRVENNECGTGSINGCVMGSVLHKESVLHPRSMVEYCHFELPLTIGAGSLISNCEALSCLETDKRLSIPANVFMHTVPVVVKNITRYVTVVFGSDDDLKKKVPVGKFRELKFCGRQLKEAFEKPLDACSDVSGGDGESHVSLWTVKLFPMADSMSESFCRAVSLIDALESGSKWAPLSSDEPVSMADIVKSKDVSSMLLFRNTLAALVKDSKGK